MDEEIIVPIKLNEKTVKILVEFLNTTDWDEMRFFVEDILREADKVTFKMNTMTKQIMKENPFSQKHL